MESNICRKSYGCQEKNAVRSIFLYNLCQMDVGKRLKDLRILCGFPTAESFAVKVGVSRAAITNFENDYSSPSVDTIQRLIQHLPCSLADFFSSETKLPNEYRGTKRELIMLNADQQVWVDRLLKVLESGDRAVIGIVQNALMMSEKVPDISAVKRGTASPKETAANDGGKKEKPGLQKTGTR